MSRHRYSNISSKIIKEKPNIFVSFLGYRFKAPVANSEFSLVLKQTNITPVFIKVERYSRDNYRPVSILPDEFKIFEQCNFCQINEYMCWFYLKYLFGDNNRDREENRFFDLFYI